MSTTAAVKPISSCSTETVPVYTVELGWQYDPRLTKEQNYTNFCERLDHANTVLKELTK